ncbi:MAG: hypothetical protein AAB480_03750 [Patescibacteria group bacterium]
MRISLSLIAVMVAGIGTAIGIATGIGVSITGYGVPYLMERETRFANEEIVVTRGIGFMHTLSYVRNMRTGDEYVRELQSSPFGGRRYVSINVSAQCRCITSMHWNDGDEPFSVFRNAGHMNLITGKNISVVKAVSLAEVQDKFDRAQVLLDNTRRRFEPIVASMAK